MTNLILYLMGINALTALIFFYDKRQSQSGGWRVPENSLLGLAILGGSLGAKFAQLKFRHKTRKQPFGHILNAILVLQILLVLALALPWTRTILLSPT
ncbi:DUF1294 domain-containing protein [Amylibacter sp. IMCC11727]|uniref:DUF1294 domain-containing protein n=1 Tax=Amylibacter sp. IMCC11727 TaxID=3039851 RepID=UPI00244DFFFB|nr:DUF1294 domain-containing protein [Amylibacter sp. IMCC11727]WGI21447.1 DUF1294 domain-containing protein [Amylibacter sp. IMCC11727]